MRNILDSSKINESAIKSMENYHPEYVEEVSREMESNRYLIVGMKQNPVVKSAIKTLEDKQITYKYLEYGSYFSKWKQRLAIKLWTGWPTFPMVFVDGKLIGGGEELKKLLG